MGNSHVGNHDSDPESTTDSDSMANSVELRLIMAYVKRRQMKIEFHGGPTPLDADTKPEGPSSSKTPTKARNEAKDFPTEMFAGGGDDSDDDEVTDEELEGAVSKLIETTGEIPFTPPEQQFVSEDDAVEKVIGLLLRKAGDRLNQQELIDAGVAMELFWDYSFFETLMRTLLTRMGLRTSNAPGPQAPPRTQIAVTCEVTSRLSALDTLPMSRMLDHGARYLQDHYSYWARQHGGYGEAFYSDNEEEAQ